MCVFVCVCVCVCVCVRIGSKDALLPVCVAASTLSPGMHISPSAHTLYEYENECRMSRMSAE